MDDFVPLANQMALGFAADANGNLFVTGWTSAGNGIGPYYGLVRESVGGTGSWTTVDTSANTTPYAIAADHVGNVFVGGQGNLTGSSAVQWVVRKN